jgi:lipopolysaccharide export system permease protein
VSSEDSDILQLVLRDGHYYEDIRTRSSNDNKKHPFAKSNFETYTINMDLSELNNVDMDEERDISTDKMKNISRLSKDIDSLRKDNIKTVETFSRSIANRMGAFIPLANPVDTTAYKKPIDSLFVPLMADQSKAPRIEEVINLYQEWQTAQLISSAKNSTNNILTSVEGKKQELENKYKIYNLHILSLHKKYALALSCIILFFVGAPLGAIIRKGGLGLPMVIAIILFLTYYFIGVFAGNYAKEGNIHPILGAWLSTLIMLPLGVSLTRRATADKGLMSFGNIADFFKLLFRKIFTSAKS